MDKLGLIICFMIVFVVGPLFHLTEQRGLDPTEMDSIGQMYLYGAIEASVATFILWLIMKIVKFRKSKHAFFKTD